MMVRLRPNLSANTPNTRYPGSIPARFRMTRNDVTSNRLKSRPPLDIGRARYAGIQVKRPHQANIPKVFILTRANKRGRAPRQRAIFSLLDAGAFIWLSHNAGSGTLC